MKLSIYHKMSGSAINTLVDTEVGALNSTKADKTNVLELDNETPYTPSNSYNPATKLYVDTVTSGGGGGTADGNTTYGVSVEESEGAVFIRLSGSDSTTDDVYIQAGDNITISRSDADTLTISSNSGNSPGEMVDDEWFFGYFDNNHWVPMYDCYWLGSVWASATHEAGINIEAVNDWNTQFQPDKIKLFISNSSAPLYIDVNGSHGSSISKTIIDSTISTVPEILLGPYWQFGSNPTYEQLANINLSGDNNVGGFILNGIGFYKSSTTNYTFSSFLSLLGPNSEILIGTADPLVLNQEITLDHQYDLDITNLRVSYPENFFDIASSTNLYIKNIEFYTVANGWVSYLTDLFWTITAGGVWDSDIGAWRFDTSDSYQIRLDVRTDINNWVASFRPEKLRMSFDLKPIQPTVPQE